MSEQIHKRRKRYKGTHPRNFEDKYKELNPEKYPETIEKVISKGSTPAGMHISIMVDEILDFLDIQPGQVGLDCTLGYGGHTSKMLEKLEGQGHVYGLDIDSIEIEKTTQRLRNKGFDENIFTSVLTNFRNIDEVSEKYGKFDFVLADLGVSSMQIDNPERGFSYKKEGPLDLRLNPKAGRPASEILKELSKEELENILVENSDEPYADILARNIYSFIRSGMEVETTGQLYKIIDKTLNFIEDKNRKD
ncbi:MAG: 16S rRNA (cytosine(1402)-N(4))-methyltransferase, partial [Clostridium saudiense]|nr:16S rRNA (cytosine(1402)-N(4))-methyltransferase [Clostridium saudiense]